MFILLTHNCVVGVACGDPIMCLMVAVSTHYVFGESANIMVDLDQLGQTGLPGGCSLCLRLLGDK